MKEDGDFDEIFWKILLLSEYDLSFICRRTRKWQTMHCLWDKFLSMFVQVLQESGHVFPSESKLDRSNILDLHHFFEYMRNKKEAE